MAYYLMADRNLYIWLLVQSSKYVSATIDAGKCAAGDERLFPQQRYDDTAVQTGPSDTCRHAPFLYGPYQDISRKHNQWWRIHRRTPPVAEKRTTALLRVSRAEGRRHTYVILKHMLQKHENDPTANQWSTPMSTAPVP